MTACAAAAILTGCATSKGPMHTGSINEGAIITPSDLTPDEALAAVQKWGAAYSQNEKSKVAALNFAAALRAAGETGQAVAVSRKAAIYHPQDRDVLAAFGKALAADGQFQHALSTVQRAQRADNPDWRLLSTEGGILDSLGQHDQARARYRQALVLAPGEPQVLNNLGLSYLLTNDLAEAEKALRQAAASPNATTKIKDNLALVLRLKGKSGDASQLSGMPSADTDAPTGGATTGDPENTWGELAKM